MAGQSPRHRALLSAYYAWLKQEPCFITGRHGVDIAHIRLPVRRGPPGPRLERGLDMTARGHQGIRGFYALPLVPELHRAEYPRSLHDVSDEALWFDLRGISMDEVFSHLAQQIARFFLLHAPDATP